MLTERIQARVEREKAAHDQDDVLTRSYQLKERFAHVTRTPGYDRMRQKQAQIISEMKGARVLDYGCGWGDSAESYLTAGAEHVFGIDISENYIKSAQENCRAKGFPETHFTFAVMDAHKLEFPDASFDFVVGSGILHHLDLPVAMREIKRVLKPGGRASFMEPLADNPLLSLFRTLTPDARTDDERPLSRADLDMIAQHFESDSYFFGIFSAPVAAATSIALRPWPKNPLVKLADKLDGLARRAGVLRSWNQYVLFDLKRA